MTDIDLTRHPKGHLVASVIEPDNTRHVTFVFTPEEWEKFGVPIDPKDGASLTFPRFHHLVPQPDDTSTVTVEAQRKELEDVAFAKNTMEARRQGRRERVRERVPTDESRLP